jgi:hypothetical protein
MESFDSADPLAVGRDRRGLRAAGRFGCSMFRLGNAIDPCYGSNSNNKNENTLWRACNVMAKKKPLMDRIEEGAGTASRETFARIVRKECGLQPRTEIEDACVLRTFETLFRSYNDNPLGPEWNQSDVELAIAEGDLTLYRKIRPRLVLLRDVWKSIRLRLEPHKRFSGDVFADNLDRRIKELDRAKRSAELTSQFKAEEKLEEDAANWLEAERTLDVATEIPAEVLPGNIILAELREQWAKEDARREADKSAASENELTVGDFLRVGFWILMAVVFVLFVINLLAQPRI